MRGDSLTGSHRMARHKALISPLYYFLPSSFPGILDVCGLINCQIEIITCKFAKIYSVVLEEKRRVGLRVFPLIVDGGSSL